MKDAGGRNNIHFISSGRLESTVGIAKTVGGWIDVDRDKVIDGLKGMFEVDVRGFTTGIEGRNEFFKDKIVNASEFPLSSFTIAKVRGASSSALREGGCVTLQVEGTLRMRGMELPQVVLMKLSYFKTNEATKLRLPGNLLRLETNFDVDLKAFGIQIPSLYTLSYSPFVQVFVDLLGTDQPPGALPLPPQEAPQKNGKKK